MRTLGHAIGPIGAATTHLVATRLRRGTTPMNPTIILVGADKGGVGKTTVTRVLLDYLAANNVFTRAFDTESPRGTLKRFHPVGTEIVDVSATTDHMRIIDTLTSSDSKVSII